MAKSKSEKCVTDVFEIKQDDSRTKTSELELGKIILSFNGKSTLLFLFGDKIDDMAMMSTPEVTKLRDFLNQYLEQFKNK